MTETGTRRYRSPLRDRQAAETRQRVLEAAGEVFGERGYAGATLAAIAERAGVSLETVKGNGKKWALMLAAYELAFGGREGEHPAEIELAELDAAGPIDPEVIVGAMLDFVIEGNRRASRLWIAFQAAAGADEALAAPLQALIDRRDSDLLFSVAVLADRGWRPRASVDETAAILGYLVAPESHLHFVERAGWSETRYRRWLDSSIRALFEID